MTQLPDSVRRAIRTFLQAFVAVFAISLLGWLGDVTLWAKCVDNCKDFPDVTVLGKAAIAGFAAGAVTLVSLIQNLLEDKTSFPAILKAPSSDGQNPAPNDAGAADYVVAGGVLAVVGLLLYLLTVGALSTIGLVLLIVGVVLLAVSLIRR